ncbi:aldo/keto reductase [Chloroflexota bacterium]
MQYRNLGKTGLKVSAICLGTMNYGNQVNEADADRIIKTALASGVNFFDTADMYVDGKSEEIVGKALKHERHSIVLATKVANRVGPGVNDIGLSRKHIMKAVEDSLRRLQTDYIDLYYAHMPDNETELEETLRTFDDLVRQGKVHYIGCSNYAAWQLCKALWVSDIHNLVRFDCISPPYNLLTREIERELLPLCTSEGVGVCVYNPLAGGLLTGKHVYDKPPLEGTRFALERWGPMYSERYWSATNFNAVSRLKQTADEHNRSLAHFALAWILDNQVITSGICGATSINQLEENIAAVEVKLTAEELQICDDIWQQLCPPQFLYERPVR